MNLSRERFEAAQTFIKSNGRPLEIARLDFEFGGGSVEQVLTALGDYHNADGGFGHALEPDLRAEESSALATSVAFQTLRALHVTGESPLVARGIAYFLESFDRQAMHWRIIPESAESAPHAPWWNQSGRERSLDVFSLNPTSEILGYLLDYPDGADTEMVNGILQRVTAALSRGTQVEMHDLLCVIRLSQSRGLASSARQQLLDRLGRLVRNTVTIDETDWKSYGLRPLQVLDGPSSPFMQGLEDAVEKNLVYEIETQQEDGAWRPTWTWGGVFPEETARADLEWRGVLTLETLLKLRAFGRIDGIT